MAVALIFELQLQSRVFILGKVLEETFTIVVLDG